MSNARQNPGHGGPGGGAGVWSMEDVRKGYLFYLNGK